MSVNNLLLWEKYRPRKFEDIILPKRISERFEKEFHNTIYYTDTTVLVRLV
jgi:hypothetical protein